MVFNNPSSEEAVEDNVFEMALPVIIGEEGRNKRLLEICLRGNNKYLLLYFFVQDDRLLSMLELY